MAGGSSATFRKYFEVLFRDGTAAGLSDGQLLDRVVRGPADAAEVAFAALVERHGPMVLRVCRQILGDPHDAEDASQATFLVLARKARSIRRADSVASWLYGVACRTAARAKALAARRRARERRGEEIMGGLVDRGQTPETWPELHEEIGRLPEKFRRAIVLCHLEGLSHQQAAQQLRCPVRTVQSRLARGRERLRAGLARRGIGPAGAALLAAPTPEAGATTLPVAWKQSTVEAAVRFAAGGPKAASVPAPVAALAEGVLRAMLLAKLKLAAAAALLAVAILCGFAAASRPASPAPDEAGHPYRVTLKGGATIEVVCVSSYPPGPRTWWKPDGTPLDEAPVDPMEANPGAGDGEVTRVILARVSGVRHDDTFRWLPTHDGSYWGGRPTKGGRPAPGLEYYVASFRRDRAGCEVRATVAAGPWATEASSDGGRDPHSMSQNNHQFYFGKARPYRLRYGPIDEPGTAIAVAHDINGRDCRLVAIDQDGKARPAVFSTAGWGATLNLFDAEFRLPPERIKAYQVQSRPFERAEIGSIALRPRSGQGDAPTKPRSAPQAASGSDDRPPSPGPGDKDSDGDGLSDYQEIHKYRTDPAKFSTAGDGVPDGDWQRRREFTYTIRTVIKVMPPVNLACLNDDYQDARVLSQGANSVELEVVHYPLNTNAEAIRGNPDWRRDAGRMEKSLRPGVTTNWDDAMRRDLVAALKADGIDPDRLDDKELVLRASRWLFANSKYREMFCTHYVHYPEGRAAIYPGLERQFEREKGDPSWSVQEQLDHELFGRSMFARRTHGSCTSSAVYLTTALRALGIPTRMVLAIPVVDGNDEAQLAMVRDGLHHHRARRTVLLGASGARGYAAHTFNEVYVGGRWVRLNYAALGQNILDANYMGLMTHVNTFDDLSDAGLAATWGKRYALGERDDLFRYSNPYKAQEVSDHFGRYARVENPEAREHRAITLGRAYWMDSDDAPAAVRQTGWGRSPGGHVVVHGEEWFDDEPYHQYKVFMQAADKQFLFRAEGRPDVRGQISMSFVTQPSAGLREMEILIPPAEYARMESGVEYTLTPRNEAAGYQWKTKGPITIKKP
jgi:RNA polymerase sigma factor (sigma-70 family)